MDAIETLTEPPETSRREKRKLEIRARIQDSAYTLFRDQGIQDTSIEQICIAADVARRTFYGYYPNKDALLRELSRERVSNTAQGMIEQVMTEHSSTRGRVSAMIDYMAANIRQYSEIDRKLILITPVSADDDNHLRELSASVQDHFRQVFKAGIANGDLGQRFSPEILSEMIMGTFNNMMVSWAVDARFPIFEKLEEARDLFDHILAQT